MPKMSMIFSQLTFEFVAPCIFSYSSHLFLFPLFLPFRIFLSTFHLSLSFPSWSNSNSNSLAAQNLLAMLTRVEVNKIQGHCLLQLTSRHSKLVLSSELPTLAHYSDILVPDKNECRECNVYLVRWHRTGFLVSLAAMAVAIVRGMNRQALPP